MPTVPDPHLLLGWAPSLHARGSFSGGPAGDRSIDGDANGRAGGVVVVAVGVVIIMVMAVWWG